MRMPSSYILLICVALLLSSCSKKKPESRISLKIPKESTFPASPEKFVDLADKSSTTTANLAENVSNDGFSSPGLTLKNGNALLCSDGGWIFILNSTTGEVVNATKTNYPLDGSPVVFDGRMFIGDSDGVFRSINLSAKNINPNSPQNKNKIESANFANRPIGNLTQKKYKNLNDWSFKTEGKVVGGCVVLKGQNGLEDAGIVFGSYDTNIYCLEAASGKLRWKVKTGNFINGSPKLVNGELCVGGCDGKLRFITPKTGASLSAIEMGSYIPSSPAVAGAQCVVSLYTGEIVCVNAKSHRVAWRWKTEKKSARLNFTTTPLIHGDSVLAVSTKGTCIGLSLKTGKFLWETTIPDSVEAQPVVLPDEHFLVVVDSDGTVHILDISSGRKFASFATGEPISATPIALGEGRFLLASEDGIVTALRTTRYRGRKPTISRLWRRRPHSVWREKHPNRLPKP